MHPPKKIQKHFKGSKAKKFQSRWWKQVQRPPQLNTTSGLSKSLVLRAKNGYVALKLKKMAYVWLSVSVNKRLLKRGEVVQAVIIVMGLLASEELMKDSPDLQKWVAWPVALKLKKMAYVLLSVNVTIINPIKVAGFGSKERLRSSEIKEDGLRFVERQCDDHQPYQSRWFWEQRTAM